MNTMHLPRFTAETSLYKTCRRYYTAASDTTFYSNFVILQEHLPPGLCGKASMLCLDPAEGGQWCDILKRCLDEGDSGTTVCSPGFVLCGTKCKNLRADPSNCGVCGISCSSGEACCGGICRNLNHDPMNCGSCGISCGPEETCCSGICTNLSNDRMNCGSCGVSCSECCYEGTCGTTVECPNSGTSCCPPEFPVCRSVRIPLDGERELCVPRLPF